MFKVDSVVVVLIFLTCNVWFYADLVECSNNATQHRNSGINTNKTKLVKSEINKNELFKTRVENKAIKLKETKEKQTNVKDKGQNQREAAKGMLQKKKLTATMNRKVDATEKKGQSNKGSLRMGNRDKLVKWPKIQKRRLRDRTPPGSTRMTNMNMMQMNSRENEVTHPSALALANEDDINEVLSQYNIKNQMIRIGAKFKDANFSVEVIGRTLEYNDIVLVKISKINHEVSLRTDDNKYVDDTNDKKIMFIVHGLSTMGMSSLDCLVQEKKFVRLLSYYLEHLDKFDIFLVPLANPDGYGNKLKNWNKNLSPQDACPGVALDRNFDIAWNVSRPISSCSQQYPGPSPFSEPETRAMRDVLHRHSHKIVAYIHVHSGTYSSEVFKGDAVLYPKGYTDFQSDDDKYIDLKGEIEEVMRKASFQIYSMTVDTLYSWYGKVAGTSVDYASTVYGIPYSMEFVMQIYRDDMENVFLEVPSEEKTSNHVIGEVWKRVIDVIANNIWNSLHSNEVQ